MKQLLSHRPSPSMVVALTALVIAASGTAIAATKLVKGDKLIAKNSISGNRLKNHTITATQVNLKKLGKVPSAASADLARSALTATSATNATNAVNATNATNAAHATVADSATNTSVVSIHPTKVVDAAADFASAAQIALGSKGPFSFYGKCYVNAAGRVEATTYIASTSATGMFDTEAEGRGYVTPATAEVDRKLQDVTTTAADTFVAGEGDKDFMATDGTTTIYGVVGLAAAKEGSPPAGNGPFGPGNRCMFGEAVIG